MRSGGRCNAGRPSDVPAPPITRDVLTRGRGPYRSPDQPTESRMNEKSCFTKRTHFSPLARSRRRFAATKSIGASQKRACPAAWPASSGGGGGDDRRNASRRRHQAHLRDAHFAASSSSELPPRSPWQRARDQERLAYVSNSAGEAQALGKRPYGPARP